eukprot:CAMPEP_0172734164 /NCGR_PEP_ID=MMETSP1074-20121228/109198_1 /TAXON_ID=2916 /ORGANISM="Ceratium fusus, Strain PA161109" /LENGTH=30 /DNA_ID= /DNA_START= /DNA_END= /DNA_ORIENTATION=
MTMLNRQVIAAHAALMTRFSVALCCARSVW